MNLLVKGDFLLVKEVILDNKIEGTDLNIKYDDNDYYITVEIVAVSEDLPLELSKYYPILQNESYGAIKSIVNSRFKVGTKLILQRIAKVPYKDGLYFVSFKDVLAIINEDKTIEEPRFKQESLFG